MNTRTFAYTYRLADEYATRRMFVSARTPQQAQAWVVEHLRRAIVIKIEEV